MNNAESSPSPITWPAALEHYKKHMNDSCVPYGSYQSFRNAMVMAGTTIATNKTHSTMHRATKAFVMDFIESQQQDAQPTWETAVPSQRPDRVDKMAGRGAKRHRLMVTENPAKLDIAKHLWPHGRG